ncbi:hypothetical protein V6N12_069784 [Hibiscus sabdariffa]|uniref:Uncharacterized protein n=1 Tax=Hibiscus sabdariffa TaxID=183260 RepID=A0ABR2FFB1_9ROSI
MNYEREIRGREEQRKSGEGRRRGKGCRGREEQGEGSSGLREAGGRVVVPWRSRGRVPKGCEAEKGECAAKREKEKIPIWVNY